MSILNMLNTTLSGFQLNSCLMNASGVNCTTDKELEALASSKVGAIITKSCTLESREGNPLPRYADIPFGSINSMGLPNKGIKYYIDFIERNESAEDTLTVLSIAGLSKQENIQLLKMANQSPAVKLIELNLSCPNIPGKPQTGYDFEASEALLSEAYDCCSKPIGIKLPPYFDMAHFEAMATVLKKFPVAYVCCVNSIGNAMWVDANSESTVIKPKNGFGGLGGLYIKPTALANVRMFYELLENIDIIGCGGIQNGQDAFEHILCGASMLQIGTTLWQEGVGCFNRIQNELQNIMIEKGYNGIEAFRGKLKTIQ